MVLFAGAQTQPVALRLAVFTAMTASVLFLESPFLGLRPIFLGNLSLVHDDHIAALGHRIGRLQQSQMVEFGAGRMFERLEPGGVDEIRHRNAVDLERVLLDGIADFVSILRAVACLRPEIGHGIDCHLE